MDDPATLSDDVSPPWKGELDAIVGARHGGQVSAIAARLAALEARYPNVAEIAFQLAWTYEILGRIEQAIPHYERALTLGLQPNEHASALIGLANCQRGSGLAERSVETLEAAKRQFPAYREIELYLALSLQAAGRSADAVRSLIDLVLESSEDPGLAAHQRALRYHAGKLQG